MSESRVTDLGRAQPSPFRLRPLLVRGLQAFGLRRPAMKLRRSLRRRPSYVGLRFAVRRCRVYIKSLGLAQGLLTYTRCNYLGSGRQALIRVRTPNAESSLVLRAGTADIEVFEQVYVDRLHDVDVPWDPKLIIDAGAHIGCVTVALAAKFPKATIFALEPDLANFELLRQNVSPYPNVTPIRAALWGEPAVLSIENPGAESWMFKMKRASPDASGITIGLTLDELLIWSGVPEIDILKIDVEGSEKNIFASALRGKWLDQVRQLHVELHDRFVPGCQEALEQAIKRCIWDFSWSTSGEYKYCGEYLKVSLHRRLHSQLGS